MAGGELARTRVMPVPHRADRRPDRVIQGNRRDLQAHMRQSGAHAVGRWSQAGPGEFSVPVVYVSKRAQPWVVRHRVALLATGVPLTILGGLATLILWVGWAWFIGGVMASVVFVGLVVRFSRGGARSSGANVSVSVNVRTK